MGVKPEEEVEMRERKRALAGVMALVVFAAVTASAFAQEKAQDDGQVRIALAEKYLFDMYKKAKSARNTAGIVGIGGGALFIGMGAALMGGEDDWLGFNDYFGALSVIMGGVMVVGGAASLAFPSPAEKAYGVRPSRTRCRGRGPARTPWPGWPGAGRERGWLGAGWSSRGGP